MKPEDLNLVFPVPDSLPPPLSTDNAEGLQSGSQNKSVSRPHGSTMEGIYQWSLLLCPKQEEKVLPCQIKVFGGDSEVQRSFLSQQADVTPPQEVSFILSRSTLWPFCCTEMAVFFSTVAQREGPPAPRSQVHEALAAHRWGCCIPPGPACTWSSLAISPSQRFSFNCTLVSWGIRGGGTERLPRSVSEFQAKAHNAPP